MLRRIIVTALAAAMFLVAAAGPAFGWANGGDSGNGFGTHDWILAHAIKLAGAKASWVNLKVALLATDDPDNGPNRVSLNLHNYKGTGPAQGAPQAVADEYYQVVKYYRAGNYTAASMHLGRMSHFYSDITQPFHTDLRGSGESNPNHRHYEHAVSALMYHYTDCASLITPRARQTVTDVRAAAVNAALYARPKYYTVAHSFATTGKITGAGKTDTFLVLNRAINDQADIISGITSGTGLAKAPAVMKQRMTQPSFYYPRPGTSTADKICTDVYCYDASGTPMRAVRVTFTWPLPTGPKTVVAYTDANGHAYNWQAPGVGMPLMTPRSLKAASSSSGKVATSTTHYTPTPVLADGSTGFSTRMVDSRPVYGSSARAWARAVSVSGHAVVGLPISFSWELESTTTVVTAKTDSRGYAYSSIPLQDVEVGGQYYVRCNTYAGRHARYAYTWFIPVEYIR